MTRNWAPVGWFPAGLITWYAVGGKAMALATGWMAMSCGAEPRLRAAWTGEQGCGQHFWPGGDFVLNVPNAVCLEKLQRLVSAGHTCFDVAAELGMALAPGLVALAPRLNDCALQIECCHAHIVSNPFDAEIVGAVALLHRGEQIIDPAKVKDLCVLRPFDAQMAGMLTA